MYIHPDAQRVLDALISCSNRTPDGYILDGPVVLFPGEDARKGGGSYAALSNLESLGLIEVYKLVIKAPKLSGDYPQTVRLVRVCLDEAAWGEAIKQVGNPFARLFEQEKSIRLA
jgi:hypothetical protein